MKHNNNSKPITRKELREELGEFTDQVLLPALDKLIDFKLEQKLEEKLEQKLEEKLEAKMTRFPDKAYLTDKLADLAVEIYQRLERRLAKEKDFKIKVTEILKRHQLASQEEIKYLEDLI